MPSVQEVLARARSACGHGTVYWAGAGGVRADTASPTTALAVGQQWPSLPPEQQAEFAPIAAAAGLDVHDPALVVRACDCSGLVCWALGFGRRTTPAPFTDPAGWIFTDSIWNDAMGNGARFQRRERASPGALVVYPKPAAGERFGHVALVTEVDAAGKATRVIDCSAVNFRNAPFDAVQVTRPEAFERHPESIYAWCRSVG